MLTLTQLDDLAATCADRIEAARKKLPLCENTIQEARVREYITFNTIIGTLVLEHAELRGLIMRDKGQTKYTVTNN